MTGHLVCQQILAPRRRGPRHRTSRNRPGRGSVATPTAASARRPASCCAASGLPTVAAFRKRGPPPEFDLGASVPGAGGHRNRRRAHRLAAHAVLMADAPWPPWPATPWPAPAPVREPTAWTAVTRLTAHYTIGSWVLQGDPLNRSIKAHHDCPHQRRPQRLFMQSALANAVTISSITRLPPASSPTPPRPRPRQRRVASSAPRAWSN